MKKILFFLVFIFFMPVMVPAQEQVVASPEAIEQLQQYQQQQLQQQPVSEPPASDGQTTMDIQQDSSSNFNILDLKNAEILDVLKLISKKSGLNVVATQNVKGKINVYLKDIDVFEALKVIVEMNDWAYVKEEGIIKVMLEKEYEDKFGFPFGQESSTVIRQLKHSTMADLLSVLNQVKSANGKIITDERSKTVIMVDKPNKLKEMEEIIDRLDVPVTTEVFDLSYAKAEDLSGKITELLTPSVGSMKFDNRTNKLIVSDAPVKLEKIRQLVKEFDQKDKQVLVNAKIIQITLSDQTKLGIDWEVLVDDYHALNLKTDMDVLSDTEKRGQLKIGTLAQDKYEATLQALQTLGTSDILSSPSIATLNNVEAKILIGSTEAYVTTTTTTPASGPTTTAESVTFLDVGVKLYVTPTIHDDGYITMKIKPEVSSVIRNLVTSNNNTIPIIGTSEAETVVNVKDRVTIVIGGLIKQENIKTRNQVPIFGKLPVLGNFFSKTDDSKVKSEIAIFLTPTIVSGNAEQDK